NKTSLSECHDRAAAESGEHGANPVAVIALAGAFRADRSSHLYSGHRVGLWRRRTGAILVWPAHTTSGDRFERPGFALVCALFRAADLTRVLSQPGVHPGVRLRGCLQRPRGTLHGPTA